MSTAVISHLQNAKLRSRPAAGSPYLLITLWPVILLSADVLGLGIAAAFAQWCIGHTLAHLISVPVMVVTLFCATDVYKLRAADAATELGRLFCSICLAGLSLACVAAEYSDRPCMISGLLWLGFAIPVLITLRLVLRSLLIRSGQGLTPAVIIGSGAPAARLRELLTKHTHLGLRPIAIVDEAHASTQCYTADLGRPVCNLDGATAFQISTHVFDPPRHAIQRIVDLAFAPVLAIVLSPLLIAISLSIWLSSRGPILFRQTRIGRNGEMFEMWKFRSMVVDSEHVLKAHLAANPEAKREWELSQKLRHDPRVLSIGRWLRRSSCDELPQLWNVIRGDMSLVGPRPVVPDEIVRYGSASELYGSVRPGMTGLWQVSGRSNTSYQERVSLDEYYVKNRSVRLDFQILIRTAETLLLGEGAY